MDKTLDVGVKLNGRYEIVKVLGKGSFGITYKCKDTKGNCIVAIKELAPQRYSRAADGSVVPNDSDVTKQNFPKLCSRFKKEADALSSCSHPNIVKIFKQPNGKYCFEENNTLYYVMEYIDGVTLSKFIEKNDSEYSVKDLARNFIMPVAEAVKELHSRNRNHFDIKPLNIMVCQKQDSTLIPVLIDFGLVKKFSDEGVASTSYEAHGTLAYSPREQINWSGKMEFSPDFDTYALGSTFYYTLTGAPPPVKIHILPEDTNDVVRAKQFIEQSRDDDRNKRYQKIDDFIDDLKRVIDGTFTPRSGTIDDDPGWGNVVPDMSFDNFDTYSKARDAENRQVGDLRWGQDAAGDWYLVNSQGEKLSPAVAAYNNYQDGFFLVKNSVGKFNYIDKSGKLLDDRRWYDEAESFSDGIAIVGIKDKGYNYINQNGKLFSLEQWFASAGVFRAGFGLVKTDKGYNYIDANGNYLLPLWVESAKNFDAKLRTAEIIIKGKNYTALSNGSIKISSTDVLIPRNRISVITLYDESEMVTDSILWCKRDGLWYLMKIETNDELLVLNSEGFTEYSPFSDGVARVARADGKENYIGMDGSLIIPWSPKVFPFQCGVVRVQCSENLYYYCDKSGKPYFPGILCSDATDFVDGRAKGKIGNETITLDIHGNIIDEHNQNFKTIINNLSKKVGKGIDGFLIDSSDIAIVWRDNRNNLSDKNGRILSDIWFDYIYPLYSDGIPIGYVYLARQGDDYNLLGNNGKLWFQNEYFVKIDIFDDFIILKRKNEKNRIINKVGDVIISDIDFDWNSIENYDNNTISFKVGDFECHIGDDGESLYFAENDEDLVAVDEIISYSEKTLLVKVDGKYNFVTRDKKFISEEGYDYAEPFVDGYAVVKDKDGYKYINSVGTASHGTGFEMAYPMKSGFGRVKKNGKYAYLYRNWNKGYLKLRRTDSTESWIWFDEASDFNEDGIAFFRVGGEKYKYNSKSENLAAKQVENKTPVSQSGNEAETAPKSPDTTDEPLTWKEILIFIAICLAWISILAAGFYKLVNGELIYNIWVTLVFLGFAVWSTYMFIKLFTDHNV